MKQLQSSTIFKQRNNRELSYNLNFRLNFFTTPNSQNIIGTLHIVTIEKSDLILLALNFYD